MSTPAPGQHGLPGLPAVPHVAVATPSDPEFTVAPANVKNKQCDAIFTLVHTVSGLTGLTAPPHATVVPASVLDLTTVANPTMFKQSRAVQLVTTLPGLSGLVAPPATNTTTNPSPPPEPASTTAPPNPKSKRKHVLLPAVPTGPHGAAGHHAQPAAEMAKPHEPASAPDLMNSAPP